MKARTFLLPAFLALSLLAASGDPLPPMPSAVYSRYGPVPVDLVKAIPCPDSTGVTPTGVIGCYNAIARRISIADTLSLRWQQFVLGHEQCHLAMRDVDLRFSDRADEERVCWAMARWRLGDLEGHS